MYLVCSKSDLCRWKREKEKESHKSMKRKRKLIFGIVAVLVVSVLLLSGCTVDVDKKYNGLSVDFNYQHPKSIDTIVVAVRSDKTEFAIDDVTLDFYIGWRETQPRIIEKSDEWDYTVGFTVFVSGSNHLDDRVFYGEEIPAEEFVTDAYKMTMTKRAGKQFRFHTSLKVPKALFDEYHQFDKSHEIFFGYAVVKYSHTKGEKEYQLCGGTYRGFSRMAVHYVDENTVRLCK